MSDYEDHIDHKARTATEAVQALVARAKGSFDAGYAVARNEFDRRYDGIAASRDRWQIRALAAEAAAERLRGVSGTPRSVLIVLTPPGVEPSENAAFGAWHSGPSVEADLVIAASVDDSYVKVLKHRHGREDNIDVKVRWQR